MNPVKLIPLCADARSGGSRRLAAVAFLSWSLLLAACASGGGLPGASSLAVPNVPAVGPALERIALGSCADHTRSQPIWEAVLAAEPDLFLMLGDNVYADTEDAAEMRGAYEVMGSIPAFAELQRRVPMLATWDDHDYGANDAGVEFPAKESSKQIQLSFFQVPRDAPVWHRPGLYQARIFGPPGRRVQVILLDGRWFRSALELDPSPHFRYRPRLDPDATMLGAAQWAWLDEQLREPAEVRLIVSGVRVLSSNAGFESWATLPIERERLFALLRARRAGGVVVLSGDAHFTELSRGDAGLGYPLYEFTSSSLNLSNHRGVARPAPLAIHGPHGDPNFGVIDLVWDPEPRLLLSARSVDGAIIFEQQIQLQDLQPPSEVMD